MKSRRGNVPSNRLVWLSGKWKRIEKRKRSNTPTFLTTWLGDNVKVKSPTFEAQAGAHKLLPLATKGKPSEHSDCSVLLSDTTDWAPILISGLTLPGWRGEPRRSEPRGNENKHKSFINIRGGAGFSFSPTEPLRGLQLFSWQCLNIALWAFYKAELNELMQKQLLLSLQDRVWPYLTPYFFCTFKAIKNTVFAGLSQRASKTLCRKHAQKLWLFLTLPLTHACVVQVSFYKREYMAVSSLTTRSYLLHRTCFISQIFLHCHQSSKSIESLFFLNKIQL